MEGLFVDLCRAERVSNVCVVVGETLSRRLNPLHHLVGRGISEREELQVVCRARPGVALEYRQYSAVELNDYGETHTYI